MKYLPLLAALLLELACGDNITPNHGDVCGIDDDCIDSLCITKFSDTVVPFGVCTEFCDRHDECPGGFYCLRDTRSQDFSAICMQACGRWRHKDACRRGLSCELVSFEPWRLACVPEFE